MFKLQNDDIDRIERYTASKAEDLSEEELVTSMRELGITRIELNDDDRKKLERS